MASLALNKGSWSSEEDKRLSEVIQTHGAKGWNTIATIAGLNRCGKSSRMRWLNYLRPNIKRGNMTDQEEDLILRLHKLLGNRWSLSAGRIPGRIDNEVKNYWNSHLSKKINIMKKQINPPSEDGNTRKGKEICNKTINTEAVTKVQQTSTYDAFYDFSNESPITLE